jgi:cation diffusion facilitator family transporter
VIKSHVHEFQQWRHQHVFHQTDPIAERNTWFVVSLTAVMMLVEIAAGLLFHSMALLADGWHMATHVVALGMAGLAYFFARKYAHDIRFAFGSWKIEVLGAYSSAILLAAIAIGIGVESLFRLARPLSIQYDQALWVALVGLAVNLASALLLKGAEHPGHTHEHRHGHQHHAHEDLNLRSAYAHVVTDALTSILAIAALLGGKVYGWQWLDPVMGIVGAIIVGIWAIGLVRDAGKVLLDREMDQPIVERVRNALQSDGDAHVCDLHVWRIGRERYACVATVVADRPKTPDEYRSRLEPWGEIAHVSIEVNVCPGQE